MTETDIYSADMMPEEHTPAGSLAVILGPTASGKTRAAVRFALKHNGEIISADSRQVYRGMDIGTGKDLTEYQTESGIITHHLIDIYEPEEDYDMFRFRSDFLTAWQDITGRGKLPVLCGGSAMYIDSVLRNYELRVSSPVDDGLDALSGEELRERLLQLRPELHNTTDLLERARMIKALRIASSSGDIYTLPSMRIMVFGITHPLPVLRQRIGMRLKQRLEEGMIAEAERLLVRGISHERLHYFGLEYKYISMYLKGELNLNDMRQKLESGIYEFARKQLKWYRKMEREGVTIHWVTEEELLRVNLSKVTALKQSL